MEVSPMKPQGSLEALSEVSPSPIRWEGEGIFLFWQLI